MSLRSMSRLVLRNEVSWSTAVVALLLLLKVEDS
jgi:hypothetical protein